MVVWSNDRQVTPITSLNCSKCPNHVTNGLSGVLPSCYHSTYSECAYSPLGLKRLNFLGGNMGILSGSTPVKRAKILNICLFGSFTPFMFSIIKNKNRGLIFFVLNWIAVAAISANSNSNSTQSSESSGKLSG